MGHMKDTHEHNIENSPGLNPHVHSFVRFPEDQQLLVTSAFDTQHTSACQLQTPKDLMATWNLDKTKYPLKDLLYGGSNKLTLRNDIGTVKIRINPLQSFIFEIQ